MIGTALAALRAGTPDQAASRKALAELLATMDRMSGKASTAGDMLASGQGLDLGLSLNTLLTGSMLATVILFWRTGARG